MGLYNLANPGRAGDDVAKYDGWPMANILRDFMLDKPALNDLERIRLRRAILVSYEYRAISKGARVNV